jgi:prepilin-type N-terminal cleavage/methylation domain-containing protein
MLARIRAARENESGFTLIELLIVIVILGVLSGIVVFSVSGITNNSAKVACKADVNIVQIASEAYFAQNGAYATSVAPLTPIDTLVTAKLLKSIPPASEVITLTTAGVVGSTFCP